jgi:hypothetical protein
MEENLDAYYDAVRDMFLSEGWRFFLEDLNRFTTSLSDVREVRDAEDLFYKQGQLNIVDFVKSYEEAIVEAQQTLEAEAEE